jgi:hypothetical protein
MFRPAPFVTDERAGRKFTFMPHKIASKPDGSLVVVFSDGNKLVEYTPKEIAQLLKEQGLRADETLRIGLPDNQYAPSNYKSLPEFAKQLNSEIDNSILYMGDSKVFIDPENLAYSKSGVTNVANAPEYLNTSLVATGEKKPLLLLCESNFNVVEKDNLYIVVEGFTNGKARVYRPQLQRVDELTPSEFLKEIETTFGKDYEVVKNKPMRIVSKGGVEDEASAKKFIEEMAQKAKVKVEVSTGAVEVAEGAEIPIKDLKWLGHAPTDDGLYFLKKNITDAQQWRKLNGYGDEEFLKQLGRALEENNGKYLKDFKKSENFGWLESIYQDYLKYKKVSLPTFVNIESIAKQLEIELFDTPWLKELRQKAYENPLFAKTLDNQLKWLTPDALEDLARDIDLLKKAINHVESQTTYGGKSLAYFLTHENLSEKLPSEIFSALKMKFGENERFFTSLGDEIDKLDKEALKKFNRSLADNPDYLDEFKTLYEIPGRKIGLADFLNRVQRKSQLFLAGADARMQNIADQLTPQAETFTLIVRADGDGFIEVLPDGSKRLIRPKEMADIIKANENYVEGTPLRIVVNGTSDSDKTVQALIDHMDVDAQVYSKGPFNVEEGKLLGQWDRKSPDIPSNIVLVEETDVVNRLVKDVTPDPAYLDVFIHGEPNNFVIRENGVWMKMNPGGLAGRLRNHPAFAKAIREGKSLRLISCSSGAGDAAKGLSRELPEIGIIAPNVPVTVQDGKVMAEVEDAFWGGFKNGESQGRISTIPLVETRIATASELVIKGEQKNVVEIWVSPYRVPVGKGTLLEDGSLKIDVNVNIGLNEAPVAKAEEVEQKIKDEIIRRNGSGSIVPKVTAIPMPNGAIEATNPNYIIYTTSEGKKRIRFRASESVTGQAANAGRLYTTEGAAALTNDGKVFVIEGRHRAIGAAHGDIISEDLGGVAPDVLDYGFETPKYSLDAKVSVRDLKVDYSVQDLSLDEADLLWHARNGNGNEKIESAFRLFDSQPNPDQAYIDFKELVKHDRKFPSELTEKEEVMLRYYEAKGHRDIEEALQKGKLPPYLEVEKIIVDNSLNKLPNYSPTALSSEIALVLPLDDTKIISSLSLGGSKEDGSVLQALERLQQTDVSEELSIVFHTGEKGEILILGNNGWTEVLTPEKAAEEIIGKINELIKAGKAPKKLSFNTCVCSGLKNSPIQAIVDNMPRNLNIVYEGPGGNLGDNFLELGVRKGDGKMMRLNADPNEPDLYIMGFEPGKQPASTGRPIPKAAPGEDAFSLGWWSRNKNKFDLEPTIKTELMRPRRLDQGFIVEYIEDDPIYYNLLSKGRWREADQIIEIEAINEKLLEENLASIYIAHIVPGIDSYGCRMENVKGILVKWSATATPLQWSQYLKELTKASQVIEVAAGRTLVGQALRREGMRASVHPPFSYIKKLPSSNPDEVVFLFSKLPESSGGPFR